MTFEDLKKELQKLDLKSFSIGEKAKNSYCIEKIGEKIYTYTVFSDNEKNNIEEYDNENEACIAFSKKMKSIYDLRRKKK